MIWPLTYTRLPNQLVVVTPPVGEPLLGSAADTHGKADLA
jgi:hypothetical protein